VLLKWNIYILFKLCSFGKINGWDNEYFIFDILNKKYLLLSTFILNLVKDEMTW